MTKASRSPTPTIIAGDQRLSRSLIWQIQRAYFLNSGMAAWQEDIVPHHISSNPFMARTYGRIVMAYLHDYYQEVQTAVSANTPITIVELGAGSGRLAYHFLHQFLPQWQQSPFVHLPIKYIMTDFVPTILDDWQQHPRLQPWIEAGILDVAYFDAQHPQPLTLRYSQQTINTMHPPLILIANYFFDSIPQDSFVIEDGQLFENLLTLYSNQPEANLADPTIWNRLSLAYEAIPLAKPYYDNPIFNHLLDEYEQTLDDTTLLFPNVALDCLHFWQKIATNGRLLLLSSDRGYTLPDSLLAQGDPLPNLHGSFSLMVNYHAIAQYVQWHGGIPLHPAHYQNNLQVAAYLLGKHEGLETGRTFADLMNHHGPDDFFSHKQALEPHYHTLTLPQLLSHLRYSCYDTDIFWDCQPHLVRHMQETSPAWYPDIAQTLSHIWQSHFPLDNSRELATVLEKMLVQIGYQSELKKILGHQ